LRIDVLVVQPGAEGGLVDTELSQHLVQCSVRDLVLVERDRDGVMAFCGKALARPDAVCPASAPAILADVALPLDGLDDV